MILELHHIYKDYKQDNMDIPVLKDISLSVSEGEYVAVMGPSGSGKTTLMNIIGCLDHPTKGEYFFDGNNVLELNENQMSDMRLKEIGFVFQNFYLMDQENAMENVALPLNYVKNISKEERRERAKEMLAKVGLEDRMTFKPNQLSGGQKQRVAIARAMINRPKVLLADEPTGALDSKSGEQIMDLFRKLNEEGVTIIMITHDNGIASHAKRIIHIKDGELYEEEN